MHKGLDLKQLFIGLLLLLPLIYIGLGWWVGLNYGRKTVIFGPYPDIPLVISVDIEDLSDLETVVCLANLRQVKQAGKGNNKVCFNIRGYFELPQIWGFGFKQKTFLLTGSYSRVIGREFNNPKRVLGYYSPGELCDFLKVTGRTKDISKLKPYLFLARLEKEYPWLYSDTVLLSRAMGNVFRENGVPYDILGLTGILVLFIALCVRNIWLWMYYLYWVFSCWFGRIGYHDPNLALSKEGWQVIIWSFWHGFIQKEGRLFLVIAIGLGVIMFGLSGIVRIFKQNT